MHTTSIFEKNLKAYNSNIRVVVNKGSTRSSKTWSVLQLLYIIASQSKRARVISVVSESVPHLKRGCIRDFETMLRNEGLWSEARYSRTDKIYSIGQSVIEFFSADNASKVHGPSRDILFINEAINIPYETYRQLAIRTRETIFIDYNPCHEFWVDEHVLQNRRSDSILIASTYKDNNFLTPQQITEIESNRHDEAWFRVYGLGETGAHQGVILQNWITVDELPSDYKQRWLGLDFGFTNDPTALLDVRLSGGELWVDELLYRRGVDNIDLSELIREKVQEKVTIVADSAEPKSIAELQRFRHRVEAAEKGADSVKQGIAILQRYKLNITKRSLNLIKELRNYKWKSDADGNITNTPIDAYNHAIDALRYVALNKLNANRATDKGAQAKLLKYD